MLTTETQILVPQYALPEDEAVLKQVRTHTTKQVIPVPVDDIATMGGSVHCLTWYLPQRLKP
ncbi:Peptidylarginine deiminase and related enzymes [Weissella viridescens]|nr:Peptidylarginine deiminase and related enzymes [Weissella viridescens]